MEQLLQHILREVQSAKAEVRKLQNGREPVEQCLDKIEAGIKEIEAEWHRFDKQVGLQDSALNVLNQRLFDVEAAVERIQLQLGSTPQTK